MQRISCRDARDQLPHLIESTALNRQPIAITGTGEKVAILLSAEEFAAMQETLHLLSTPANAERIRRGLADFANGNPPFAIPKPPPAR